VLSGTHFFTTDDKPVNVDAAGAGVMMKFVSTDMMNKAVSNRKARTKKDAA
jgi:hypothetical protein